MLTVQTRQSTLSCTRPRMVDSAYLQEYGKLAQAIVDGVTVPAGAPPPRALCLPRSTDVIDRL